MKKNECGKSFLLVASLFAISFVVLSCQRNSDVIKIGAILPLSGPAAPFGESARNGIQLAIDQYNESGEGETIELIIEDGAADTGTASAVMQRLIDFNDVQAIVGGMTSDVALALAPIAQANQVVLISPAASTPLLSNEGEYVFRTAYSDKFEAGALASFAACQLELENIGILRINNEYGEGFTEQFVATSEREDVNITRVELFQLEQIDFSSEIANLRSSEPEPDGILVLGYGELGRILLQLRERGISEDVSILSSVVFQDQNNLDIAQEAAEGVYYTYPDYEVSEDNDFNRSYEEKYGDPDIYAALAYEAADIVRLAINSAGNNADEIRMYFEEDLNDLNYVGPAGPLKFNEDGDAERDIAVRTVENGAFTVDGIEARCD